MSRACLLIVFALAISAGVETGAFVPLRTGGGVDYVWDLSRAQPNVISGRITYYLDPKGSQDLDTSAALAAARAGIESWGNVPHCALAFTEDSSRPATKRRSGDRINLIKWTSGDLGPFVFASTWPTFESGKLTDADIIMNEDVRLNSTLALTWSTSKVGTPKSADIQGVVTHEWGHAIGLDHEAIQGATMYYAAAAGSIYFRTLHTDDMAAVTALYPDTDKDRKTGTIRGVADVAGRSNDRGAHVVAIDASTGEVVAAKMSEPDGRYVLDALPPGSYHLVAAPFVLLNTLNTYWGSSDTSFRPSVLSTSGVNGDFATVLHVEGGQEVTGADFTLVTENRPTEPNDGPREAFNLLIGDAVVGRLETGDDEDWFSFFGTKGQTVDVHVHSAQIGGTADPSIRILDREGARTLRSNADIRDPVIYGYRVEGPNTDARIRNYTLPATGTYYLRVREESLLGTGDRSAFYALTLTQDPIGPSAALSDYSIAPDAIHADGRATAEIRVVPRNAFGEAIGEGVTIALTATGGGSIGPVTYRGAGVYGATLTAANGGPGDSIDVAMTRNGATSGASGVLSILYIGIVDADQSVFFTEPRRIPADGKSTATVTLVPMDATGYPIGTGRTVSVSTSIATPVDITSAVDVGDGTYRSLVTAPAKSGHSTLQAMVDGKALGREVTVFFGFDLLTVITDIEDEAEAVAAVDDLHSKVTKKLMKAAERLARARATLTADAEAAAGALKNVAKAAEKLKKAEKSAKGEIDLVPARTELAQAAREAARTAIDGATPDNAKRLQQAEARLAAGDEALGAGKYYRAIKKYRSALRKAVNP